MEFDGAWIESHLHVSSSKKLQLICCQTALVAPIALKICTGGFQHALWPLQEYKLYVLKLCWVDVSSTTNIFKKRFEHLN